VSTFAVVNESRDVTEAEAQAWVAACDAQMQLHVAPAWSRLPVQVQYFASRADVPADAALFVLSDRMDVAGAEAYHEESGDRVTGLIGVQVAKQDNVSPSIDLSHEIIEAFLDPCTNAGVVGADGNTYDLEACDGVQDQAYEVVGVQVSDFVMPAWCDPESTGSQYDYLGKLSAPFSKTEGGYLMYVDASGTRHQLGKKPARRAISLRSKRRAERFAT
jgi:hypothetical protein